MNVPAIEGSDAEALLEKLYPGSSVTNPIDFLATGNVGQLGHIIDYCDQKFDHVDGMIVIFGSPGLFEVYDVYDLLHEKMKTSKKPIFPVLPSVINVKNEIEHFLAKGRINFPDEVVLGEALSKVYHTDPPAISDIDLPKIDSKSIRSIIDKSPEGYLPPEDIQGLLDAAGIARAGEAVVTSRADAVREAQKLGLPVVMKVVGPVHKSDVGGVVLDVDSIEQVEREFDRMIEIPETSAILIQPMLKGMELFAGAKAEPKFGHLILCGLGGIFIEILKDVNAGLSPLSQEEAYKMIRDLKSYGMIKGARGKEGVNEDLFAEIILRLSSLVHAAPEIAELDLNPLLGNASQVIVVDARIRIEK
jgi:acetyltransferase